MSIEKYKLGSVSTLLSAELNGLADAALAVAGTAYDNTQGAAGDGSTLCDLELVVAFGAAPAAGSGVSVWLLGVPDGTNYEDGGSAVTPARPTDATFGLRPVTTAQRINMRVGAPWGPFKALLKNDGTGAAFAASGNTLKIRVVSREVTP